ncbi:hypothetical protein FKP32DRAFT_1596298 [Trametes sanguinea]|nr:hypothetical protein FKP32DRAFT_1596298 [Trametes sanguinea]
MSLVYLPMYLTFTVPWAPSSVFGPTYSSQDCREYCHSGSEDLRIFSAYGLSGTLKVTEMPLWIYAQDPTD